MKKSKNRTNVMIDLETLSTKPNALIVSIGAVVFNEDTIALQPIHQFKRVIDLKDPQTKLFDIDLETVRWWMSRSQNALKESFFNEYVCSIKTMLLEFRAFLFNHGVNGPLFRIWGNGSDFDNVILKNAYSTILNINPWSHTDNRCYRTIKESFPLKYEDKNLTHHDALDDAIYQANHLIKINKRYKLGIL